MSEISELFARNPLKLHPQDITKIVTHLREQRKRFVAGNKTAGSMKPKSAAQKKQADAVSITGKLDLTSLINK